MPDDSPPKPTKETTLRRAVLTGVLLVFVDAFWLNQGVVAGLVGAGLVLIGLPLALLKKPRALRAQRIRNLAIYAASVILVFVLNAINNHIAATRAAVIVSAVKTFHDKYGHYPESLSDLTPEFIDHIPLAKYTLGQNTFYYRVAEGHVALFYVKFPPFGRAIYRFPEDRWGYID
ncbi:MAG: hypothetical protein J5X23_11060 [Candidatus Accumulibacter sp.]|jgi:hypothetical protein|uniref:hypothetical protein n=1 Tax=Accumulibacter sp. TaxID=2053492 RepID=UPI001AFE306F|nr:hypothetical protein [Accumulibacter sp.]MBO3715498.1 hypothetical protein [Accumulibacter sp.]